MNIDVKISVIIPSYKPQSYLWECLDSVCGQTFPKEEYEVILVLNGCKEPYDGQIREYIGSHRDIQWKYIHTDEGGVSNARNLALDVVRGEFVVFIDDDDKISKSFLEKMLDAAKVDVTPICRMIAFEDKSSKQLPWWSDVFFEKHTPGQKLHKMQARPYLSSACLKLISNRQIGDRRFDRRFQNGEDALFSFSISDKIQYLSLSDASAIYYRRVRENSAVTKSRTRCQKITNGIHLIFAYSKIYFAAPCKYNFPFYLTRILASIRASLLG